ncbi:sugar phosphate permease, partial [Cryptosporidium canis]
SFKDLPVIPTMGNGRVSMAKASQVSVYISDDTFDSYYMEHKLQEYSEKYEDVEGSVYSSSTAFPSCDASSKSSKNFTSIDNLCMLIGGGAGTTKSGGLGSGNEYQKTAKLENVGIEDVLRPKGGLRCLRCDWLVGRVMEITMMKRLLPSMSKDEYNKFFLAYLSYMILYSTRKPFSVVKLQIQEDLSLSTS